MAFPGGRVEPGDRSFREAAVRETREELGADLGSVARFAGYMGRFQARRKGIWVVPSVFVARAVFPMVASREVSSHMWVSLRELLARENRSTYTLEQGGERRSFPSFNVAGRVVWGLTERILSSLLAEDLEEGAGPTSRRSP